jgi:Restriction Endonuclease associating with ARP
VAGRKDLDRRQRRWADAARVEHDARGYVRDLAANLRMPLDAAARAQIERGSELTPTSTRPGRLWSLTSSAALVLNVFDYWRSRDTAPLAAALGLPAGSPQLRFEEPLPTGLEGDPPTTDVALLWPSGGVAAIESKFGEWLVRRPRNKAVFKRKYFPPDGEVWSAARLPRCQQLAADIDSGRERFRWLHAAQLLKHALGLKRLDAPAATLVYLYYDWPSREAAEHAAEVARFAERVAADCDFRVLTYQALHAALAAAGTLDAGYRAYLEQRYFR